MILEARCEKCGETFNPLDEDDTIHGINDAGTVCGGQGIILGGWVQSGKGTINQANLKDEEAAQ